MIFSVDTCVLLDMLLPDPDFGERSKDILNEASKKGDLIICPIIYAELYPQFNEHKDLDTFLAATGIHMKPFTREILWNAGQLYWANRWNGVKCLAPRRDKVISCPHDELFFVSNVLILSVFSGHFFI